MLLLAFVGLVVVTLPLTGGRLSRLAEVRFCRLWLLMTAAGMQVGVALLSGPRDLQVALHVGSYVVAGLFFWNNRRIPGLWLIAIGGALNFLAIAANGGVMPADPAALEAAGMALHPGHFSNSVAIIDPHLRFLGDIFAIPEPFPLRNVFSIGDLTIALGAALGFHRLCGSRILPSGVGQFRALVGHRDFMRLWAAQGVSNLGDWIYALAVVASIAQRDVGAHALAALLIVQVAPSAVAGALGGPLVDRFPRRRLMMGADILRALAVASLLVAPRPSSLVHLYAVAAALGLFGALFQPSLQASLPNVVPRERLVAANALVSATFHISVMFGPVIGGLLVAGAGTGWAFAVNAGSFVLSALLLSRVRIPKPDDETAPAPSSPVAALVEGARYAIRSRLVRGVFIITALIMFGAAIRSPLEPLYVLRTLEGRPEWLGFLGGIWGLGMILGAIAAPAAARRWVRERIFGVSVILVGLAILVASQASSLVPVLFLWLIAGSGNGIGSVSYGSLLQERTPDRLRGRVMAASEAVQDIAFLLGAATAGWLGEQLGVRGAFMVAGGIFVVAGLLAGRLLLEPKRAARARLDEREPPSVSQALLTTPAAARMTPERGGSMAPVSVEAAAGPRNGDRRPHHRPIRLGLRGVPEPVREMVVGGAISARHARALRVLEAPDLQEEAARRVAQQGLTAGQVEALSKRWARKRRG